MKKVISVMIMISIFFMMSATTFATSDMSVDEMNVKELTFDKAFEIFPQAEVISNIYKVNNIQVLRNEFTTLENHLGLNYNEVYSDHKIVVEDGIVYEYKINVNNNGEVNIARVFGNNLNGGWAYYSDRKTLSNGIATYLGGTGDTIIYVTLININFTIYYGVSNKDFISSTHSFASGSIAGTVNNVGGQNLFNERTGFKKVETSSNAYAAYAGVAMFELGSDTWNFYYIP